MSDSDEDVIKTAVVIDNGSSTCRAGFAGSSQPSAVFPSVVGRPKAVGVMVGIDLKDSYVGDEAQSKRGILILKYPIEHGIVTNWDDMEKIWHHTFYNDLRVSPEEHPVFLTEPILNPKANRENMTQIMFEKFRTPAMYVAPKALLSMYASGRNTGIALHIGDGTAHVIPVYERHYLPHCTFKSLISGLDLTYYMMKFLHGNYVTHGDWAIVRNIKETLCYIAYDYNTEIDTVPVSTINKSYEMPDMNLIMVGQERFQCPEALFQPNLIGQEMPGIHEILTNAIKRCDTTIQSDMYSNIELVGGSTLFPGFTERLRKEVEALAPPGTTVQVRAASHGILSPWVGGSMMAARPSFWTGAVTKELYDEHGPDVVHRMCV